MKPPLLVFCCAIAMAWLLPRPLGRLSGDGASPRLGIAAWLTAITSVLALALAALGLLARTAVNGWPTFARTVCESVTSGTCPPAVYRSARLRARSRGHGLPRRHHPDRARLALWPQPAPGQRQDQ